MSFKSSLTRAGQRCLQTGRESFQLARLIVIEKQQSVKTVLLEQAQQEGNITALRLLSWEKEWALMRYHGVVRYLQKAPWWRSVALPGFVQRRRGFLSGCRSMNSLVDAPISNGGSSQNSSNSDESTARSKQQEEESNNSVARVAFMVTSGMKMELQELGYSVQQVRAMTPVTSSLVLQHQVPPQDYEERVPTLVQAYEQEQWAQQQQAAASTAPPTNVSMDTAETAKSSSSLAEPDDETDSTPRLSLPAGGSDAPPETTTTPESTAPPFSASLDEQHNIPEPTTISSSTTSDCESSGLLWFELVEQTDQDDKDVVVVGLYRSEKEAELSRATMEELSLRHHDKQKSTYHVRPTRR